MTELPAPVLHGTAMWILLTVWSALTAALVAWGARRRRLRGDADARRARLGVPVQEPERWRDGDALALQGRLELSGAACREFEDGRPAAAASAGPGRAADRALAVHARGDELAVAAAGRRVVLDGPLEVVVGSREGRPLAPPRWLDPGVLERLAAAAPDDELPARLVRRRLAFRSLAPGDAVRVRGVLRGGAEGGWRLTGEPGAPVRAAYDGVPVASRRVRTVAVLALSGLLAAAAAYAALYLAGDAALAAWAAPAHRAASPRVCAAPVPSPLDSTALQIAALTPSRRAAALDVLYEELVRGLADCPGDARTMDELEALGELLGRCRRTTDVLARHGSLSRAAALGERCGDPESLWTAADAAFRDGDVQRASTLFERLPAGQGRSQDRQLLRAVQAHLVAGRSDVAARALHALADALRRRAPSRRPPKASLTRLRCLGWALDARRGVLGAQAELQAAVRGSNTAFCGLLLADVLAGESRREVLELVESAAPAPPLLRLAELLGLEFAASPAGHGRAEVDPFERRLDDVLSDSSAAVAAATAVGALARQLVEPAEPAAAAPPLHDPVTRAGLALEAAGFAAAVGELDAARRLLRAAVEDLAAVVAAEAADGAPPDGGAPAELRLRRDAVRLRLAAVELLAGEDESAAAELAKVEAAGLPDPWLAPLRALLEVRRGGPLAGLAAAGAPPEPALARAWELVARGDGAGLAELVDRSRSGVTPPLLAPALGPLTNGRAAVLELLREAMPPPCTAGAEPTSVGRLAACVAGLARVVGALGEAAVAERFDRLARLFRAPLLDRARVVPLVLLELW
jgi:hypothetical protein